MQVYSCAPAATAPSTARMYSPWYFLIVVSRCSSNGSPQPALRTWLYSSAMLLSTRSDASGAPERMKDSSQPVHSCPCSQITTGSGFVSAASTTFVIMSVLSPISDVSVTQPFKKLRRLMPFAR